MNHIQPFPKWYVSIFLCLYFFFDVEPCSNGSICMQGLYKKSQKHKGFQSAPPWNCREPLQFAQSLTQTPYMTSSHEFHVAADQTPM